MASIVDDRGYNQGYVPTKALEIRTQRRFEKIIGQIDQSKHSSVLEIGCGEGDLSALLAKYLSAQVVGTDICEPFVLRATQRYSLPNLSFLVLDVNRSDLPEQLGQKFDYIIGNGILHHLYWQLPQILPVLKQLLTQQGRLIFWEPNKLNPYVFLIFSIPILRKWAKLEPGEMAFTRSWMYKTLNQAGFTECSVEYRDFLTPNMPDWLIKTAIQIGLVMEHLPLMRCCAQSLFITAQCGKNQ